MGKNIQKIRDIVDDKYSGKIQVGYQKEVEIRNVGDRWTDADGKEWEQRNGYAIKNPDKIGRGIADECSKCKKLILKKYDQDVFNRFQRCYHCQINFEVDLKEMRIGKGGNKWQFWVRLQNLLRFQQLEKEFDQWIIENDSDKKNQFDKSIANALANENLEMSIKKTSVR